MRKTGKKGSHGARANPTLSHASPPRTLAATGKATGLLSERNRSGSPLNGITNAPHVKARGKKMNTLNRNGTNSGSESVNNVPPGRSRRRITKSESSADAGGASLLKS